MNENIICKIKKIDDYDIFRLEHQLYIWFEDTNVKETITKINITKSLKQMYIFGKIIYTKLIENYKLKEDINKIEPTYNGDSFSFVLYFIKHLNPIDFEKDTIYMYIYNCLKNANLNLDKLLTPDKYSEWYKEILMVRLCNNILDNSPLIKNDDTYKNFDNIVLLLEKNKDNVDISEIYEYLCRIKNTSLMDHIDLKLLKTAIGPFIKYCGLPYYYSDQRHDISYNMKNILDSTASTIPHKNNSAEGRNMLPLNNFINICVFLYIIEESNSGTFKYLEFDLEKVIKISNKENEFNIGNLISTYSAINTYSFEYKDFVNYINKIDSIINKYYNSLYNRKFQNTICKKLSGKSIINVYDLDNLSIYLWKYYFNFLQSNKSIFDNKCSECGQSKTKYKWHYLRGNNTGKKLCDECYEKHSNILNSKRVNKYRSKNDRT